MPKSIPALILFLLCAHNCNAANSAEGSLDNIDSRFVAANFALETVIGIHNESATADIPGCDEAKSFEIFEASSQGQIIVALCERGEFSPSNVDATVTKEIAQAKDAFKHFPALAAQSLLEGAEPIMVSLEEQNQGKVTTLPYGGHGLVLVTLGYAVVSGKNATVIVQAALNSDNPRNLNKPVAALLQAVYKRLQR